jgi:hypothetical protein
MDSIIELTFGLVFFGYRKHELRSAAATSGEALQLP